jgi:hypothetical protein
MPRRRRERLLSRDAASAPLDSGMKGRVFLGPTCPVERVGPRCRRPQRTTIDVYTGSNPKLVNRVRSDRRGRFVVELSRAHASSREPRTSTAAHAGHPRERCTVSRMATLRLPALALAVVVAGSSAGCGSANTSPRSARGTGTSSGSDACPHAPHRLEATLRDGVRRTRVGRVFAVHSNSSFKERAPAVRAGVYFIAADLGVGAAVGTWAANERAFRGGRGLILALDNEARAVSPRRWRIAPRALARRFGIDPHTNGWARSRECANPTRAQASHTAA